MDKEKIMNVNQMLYLERQGMSEKDKQLFLHDLKVVIAEYMDCTDALTLDVTRTQDGFSVCILFNASRIKNVRAPQ